VYGLAYSLVGDWAGAQDVAQETFIRAYTNLEQLRAADRFAAWLRRVAFSVAMNWLKAFRPGLFRQLDGRVDLDRLEVADFRPGPAETAEHRELAGAVLGALASLPPKYRVPLTMFHLDGLSYRKVADFLDIPLGTARQIVSRARKMLKAALAAHQTEEVGPMVQEVFDEHKLPAEFTEKVLDGVPVLAWGEGRDCTFLGALEAALAVTGHPWSYSDLMGLSGVAFRVRWYQAYEGRGWCGSSPIGEHPEEIAALERATGWRLRVIVRLDEEDVRMSQYVPEIVASIDAGRPVLGYPEHLNIAVIYAYADGGRTLLVRDYFRGDEVLRVPAEKLAPMLVFLDGCGEPPPEREAFLDALRTASANWHRREMAWAAGRYWYGETAYEHWLGDIAQGGTFTEQKRRSFVGASDWNVSSLRDVRQAAVAFLGERAALLGREGEGVARRAAGLYQQQVDAVTAAADGAGAFPGPEGWTAEVRERQQELLRECRRLDGEVIAELETALAAAERDG
jgi:RNA polymerase sigma-70 factor (ECF subfamily)